MFHLEDFLELIEQLPAEFRDRSTEMRMLDLQVQRGLDKINEATKMFLNQASTLSIQERDSYLQKLDEDYACIREQAEEKVTIAETMCSLIKKYGQKVNKEILRYKYELEADNPGITEQIERKSLDAEQIVLSQRREKKKRAHGKPLNAHPLEINMQSLDADREVSSPAPSRSSAKSVSGDTAHPDVNPSAQNSRSSFSAHDDDPVLSNSSCNKHSSVERDPDLPPLKVTMKRSATNPNKMIAISNVSSSPALSSLSPISEKGGEKCCVGTAGSSAHLPNPASCKTPHSNNVNTGGSATSTPSIVTGGSSMLTFAGHESRHGRQRKLTSRVQEMLKESMHRHERRVIIVQHSSEAEDEGSGGDESELDNDNDKRTWCICNQKSYGCMVACDNKACPYEWFHYECVRLTQPPKGKWFCPRCTETKPRRSLSLDIQ